MKNEIILDVGCGATKVPGAIGIDKFNIKGVDFVHDLNEFPWPFNAGKFDRLIFCHSISHLDDICHVVNECYRLLKPGGILEIVAPHYASDNFSTDPTHKINLGYRSMHYFVSNAEIGYRYIDNAKLFKLKKSMISFREAPCSWRSNLKFNLMKYIGFEYLANKVPRMYEKFFAFIIPPSEVYFILEKPLD